GEFAARAWDFQQLSVTFYKSSIQVVTVELKGGPAYSIPERIVYFDMEYFANHEKLNGPANDVFLTFLMAHEIGHHVQGIRGMNAKGWAEAVRLFPQDEDARAAYFQKKREMQADCLAGVYFHYLKKMGHADQSQIEEARARAYTLGDDFQDLLRKFHLAQQG